MRIGAYAILPAEVRYDKRLTDRAKLLYAEITAVVGYNGACDEDASYFSKVLDCDKRTVYRNLMLLVKCGHIVRENREIKIPTGFTKPSLSLEAAADTLQSGGYDDATIEFFEKFLSIYEKGIGIKLKKKELFYHTIFQRLETFSPNELMEALTNRINLINGSEWHQANKETAGDITLLIRDDTSIHKSLNMKVKNDDVTLKPLKF